MAGKGMGAATRGGGCVGSGPKNKMMKKTSQTTGPVMMAMGGEAKMMGGGMMGYKYGGMAKKKKGSSCK
jgi:hypothetical protein